MRLETTTRALLDLAVILALVVVFFTCMRPTAITDFWWQAKTGELILQNGTIPRPSLLGGNPEILIIHAESCQ